MDETGACGVNPDEPQEMGIVEIWHLLPRDSVQLKQLLCRSCSFSMGWLVQGLPGTQLSTENPAQFLHAMTTSSLRKCSLVCLGVMAKSPACMYLVAHGN